MNWDALSAVSEAIGAIGIILSLLYVGLQVRQNTRSTKSQTRLGLAAAMGQHHYNQAIDPDLSRILLTELDDPNALTEQDHARWLWWQTALFHLYEGYFHELQEGQLSDEFVDRFNSWIGGLMQLEPFRRWWESERQQNRFTESFREHVDAVIAGANDSAWRWVSPTEILTNASSRMPTD